MVIFHSYVKLPEGTYLQVPISGGPKIGDPENLQLGETPELLFEGVGNRIPMLLLNLMVDRHFPY